MKYSIKLLCLFVCLFSFCQGKNIEIVGRSFCDLDDFQYFILYDKEEFKWSGYYLDVSNKHEEIEVDEIIREGKILPFNIAKMIIDSTYNFKNYGF